MFAIKATLDKSRPIVCIIQKLTQLESRTQQEGNPHESETKIARRDKQTFSPQNIIGEHIINKKPTWWQTSSQSSAGIYTSMRNNAGRTKLRGDLIVTALDQTQPTWCILALQWWNLFMIHAKNQCWSFDIQHLRTSLEHVCNRGSANHAHAVPNAIRTNTDSRTHKNEKTTDKHIAHRLPLDEAWTRLNKNDTMAGRTIVVTTLRPKRTRWHTYSRWTNLLTNSTNAVLIWHPE